MSLAAKSCLYIDNIYQRSTTEISKFFSLAPATVRTSLYIPQQNRESVVCSKLDFKSKLTRKSNYIMLVRTIALAVRLLIVPYVPESTLSCDFF